MKILNKVVCLILCFVLAGNSVLSVLAEKSTQGNNQVKLYSVPIIENGGIESNLNFYGYNGKYYLSLEDIAKLTRYSFEEDDDEFKLGQGIRNIWINKSTHMLFNLIHFDRDLTEYPYYLDQGEISLLEYNKKYLCEGVPMLKHLGAECSFDESGRLKIDMPEYTIWESILPNHIACCLNLDEKIECLELSLVLDCLMDSINSFSDNGMEGILKGEKKYYTTALEKTLSTDMMEYSFARNYEVTEFSKADNYFTSDVWAWIEEAGVTAYSTASEGLELYWKNYFSNRGSTSIINIDTASKTSKDLLDKSKKAIKKNLTAVKSLSSIMEVLMVIINGSTTVLNRMSYSEDAKTLLFRTINQDVFDYVKNYDIDWIESANEIMETINGDENPFIKSIHSELVSCLADKIVTEGIKKVLSYFTSGANYYVLAIQLGQIIGSFLAFDTLNAFSSELNAVFLNQIQVDVCELIESLHTQANFDSNFSDEDALEKIKDMYSLYYRTSLAFYESFIVSVKEFGGKDKEKIAALLGSKTEDSIANEIASYMYRINKCEIVPIKAYSEDSDIITSKWISQYEEKFDADSAYQSVFDAYKTMFKRKNSGDNSIWGKLDGLNEVLIMHYMMEQIYYTYHDVDENGIPELLIGVEDESESGYRICAFYTYDGTKPINLQSFCEGGYFGDRTVLKVFTDGTIYMYSSTGYLSGILGLYKFNADGSALKTIKQYEEDGTLYPETPYISGSEKKSKAEVDKLTANKENCTFVWKKLSNSVKKSTEKVYRGVVEEYQQVMGMDSDDYIAKQSRYKKQYPHINHVLMKKYHESKIHKRKYGYTYEESGPGVKVLGIYYDVDGNGKEELLIYEGIQDLLCTSVYAYDGSQVVEVLEDVLRKENTDWAYEYSSGEIIPMGCEDGYYVFDKNGYTLKHIDRESHRPSGELINEIRWNEESFYIE